MAASSLLDAAGATGAERVGARAVHQARERSVSHKDSALGASHKASVEYNAMVEYKASVECLASEEHTASVRYNSSRRAASEVEAVAEVG